MSKFEWVFEDDPCDEILTCAFFPLKWVFWCDRSCEEVAKHFSHLSHMKGFSPVWVFSCLFKCSALRKLDGHSTHWNVLEEWVFWCIRRLDGGGCNLKVIKRDSNRNPLVVKFTKNVEVWYHSQLSKWKLAPRIDQNCVFWKTVKFV